MAYSTQAETRQIRRGLLLFTRSLLALALCICTAARADTAAQTVVHLLDYLSVDYAGSVKDGKVLDESEYREQQEFAAQVITLLGDLPAVSQRDALLGLARQLKEQIDGKAAESVVTEYATNLRWKVIDAYHIAVVPRSVPNFGLGATLYASQCAGCHGAGGRGDGPAAAGLNPPPASFHDKERMSQRSLYTLYSTITLGVSGTAMAGYGKLSEAERWSLAFYTGSLAADSAELRSGEALWNTGRGKAEVGSLRAIATSTEKAVLTQHGAEIARVFAWLKTNPAVLGNDKEPPIGLARRMVTESLVAYRAGSAAGAQQMALAAYLEGFELAESALDTVDRELRQTVETQMMAYRDQMRRGESVEQVARQAQLLDELLAASADKLGSGELSPTTAGVSAFLILLREGLEALLVVMAIVAFLIKANRREALPWVHAGWLGALALGIATWFAASELIVISGATRELTEGITALLAATILLYVGFWLHSKSHARGWQQFIEHRLGEVMGRGRLWALAGVSFLAVYREAFETVLFYQALWQQVGASARPSILAGFVLAIAALALLAWLMLRYGLRLPIGLFFSACALLMAVLAVVFTGHGVKALQEAGVVAASPVATFNLPALGIYATAQTLAAQAAAISMILAAVGWTHAASRRKLAKV